MRLASPVMADTIRFWSLSADGSLTSSALVSDGASSVLVSDGAFNSSSVFRSVVAAARGELAARGRGHVVMKGRHQLAHRVPECRRCRHCFGTRCRHALRRTGHLVLQFRRGGRSGSLGSRGLV